MAAHGVDRIAEDVMDEMPQTEFLSAFDRRVDASGVLQSMSAQKPVTWAYAVHFAVHLRNSCPNVMPRQIRLLTRRDVEGMIQRDPEERFVSRCEGLDYIGQTPAVERQALLNVAVVKSFAPPRLLLNTPPCFSGRTPLPLR